MRIAVTGAKGWLGGVVSDYLEKLGHTIHRIDKPSLSGNGVIGWNLRHGPDGILPKIDALFHFAAAANVNKINDRPIISVLDNVLATGRMLEWVREANIKKFVYVSSAWVEGWPQNAHPYTATKLMGEMLCKSWGEQFGTPWTIVRLGTCYGPGGRSGTAITNFVGKALAEQPIQINGEGKATRRYLHTSDLAKAFEQIAVTDANHKILDVCGADETSVKELAQIVTDAIYTVPIEHGPDRPGDLAAEVTPYFDETCKLLDWKPQTTLWDGIQDYSTWLQKIEKERA